MYQKKNIVIIAMCIAIVFMITVFAAFQTRLTITSIGNITSNWQIEITNIDDLLIGQAYNITAPSYNETNVSFNAGFIKPGDRAIYTITVKNKGTIDAIIDEVVASTEGSSAIVYSIANLQNDAKLSAGSSMSFQVVVEFDSNATSIPSNPTKTVNMTVVAVQEQGQGLTPSNPDLDGILQFPNYLSTRILLDNHRQSDENIDFAKISSDTNGQGLYYTNVNTEDNKITYYFRGDVDNNIVQFGSYLAGATVNGITYTEETPIYWRIIRVNEDGSVRMIYNGTSPTATGQDVTIGTSTFAKITENSALRDNASVGYMYGLGNQTGKNAYQLTHSNINSSLIKTKLDEWYNEYTDLPSLRDTHLADAGFCNDRSVASGANLWSSDDTALGYEKNTTFYGAYNRLVNEYQPKFMCSNVRNDLLTTNYFKKGTQTLNVPVGLLTADEIIYAGGTANSDSNYYLNIGNNYWTLSPSSYINADNISYVFGVTAGGRLRQDRVDGSRRVRPVINLKSTVLLTDEIPTGCTKQDGTAGCPYIVKTN